MNVMNIFKFRSIACVGILFWSFSAMLGHMMGCEWLKALGVASCIAPYPKVFCQAFSHEEKEPFETFAADFILHYQTAGEAHELKITPEIYNLIKGPYNRRNVYGAVLAYGPALPPILRKKTLGYALISPAPLVLELQLPKEASNFAIQIISKTKNSNQEWLIQP